MLLKILFSRERFRIAKQRKENEQKQNRYITDGRCSTFESR